MPASDQNAADLDRGIECSVAPERLMHLGREKDPETIITAAGKRLVRQLFARQQPNVDGLAVVLTCICHEIAPATLV
jgi:hypothetical protein